MSKVTIRKKIQLMLLGVFLCLVLLEIGLRIGGHVISLRQELKNKQTLKQKGVYRIMCIGESTTADTYSKGIIPYPIQLEEILNACNKGMKFKVINKGVCAADSAFLLSKLKSNMDEYRPAMVIAMLGYNDQDTAAISYDESLKAKAKLFLKGFRVYKLARLIKQHIAHKFTEAKSCNLENNKVENEYILTRAQLPPELQILQEKYMFYVNKESFGSAAKIIEEAIRIEPDNIMWYGLLADAYICNREYNKAEALLKQVLKIKPTDFWLLNYLGRCYNSQAKYQEAEETLKKGIEIDPEYRGLYSELAKCYLEQNKIKELGMLCELIKNKGLANDYFYGFLANFYNEQGDYKEAEKYYEKANSFALKYYNPATKYNYQKIKDIVTQKGLKMVCVQYPVRSVKPLIKLFDSTEGIIFVDDEKIFKDALKSGRYEDYFYDRFAGDFGHATAKGNRLLAENIARAILKECFNKNAQ